MSKAALLINKNATPIYLSTKLLEQARKKLENEREIELETYIEIHLRLLCRAKTILKLDDILPFGKYQGERVEDIVRIDPSYVSWLVRQAGKTKFAPEVAVLLDRLMTEE